MKYIFKKYEINQIYPGGINKKYPVRYDRLGFSDLFVLFDKLEFWHLVNFQTQNYMKSTFNDNI
jgi:hypothetical protein